LYLTGYITEKVTKALEYSGRGGAGVLTGTFNAESTPYKD
jgi:hypothetical protein